MDRKNFGKIVKSLRREQINFERGDFWTQKDLAQATCLSEDIIGKIEQGRRMNLSGDELSRLADAFRLSTLERREFFSAATETYMKVERGDNGVESRRNGARSSAIDETDAQTSFDEIWNKFAAIQLPGYLTDSLSTLVGINEPMMLFHNIMLEALEQAAQTEIGCNMLTIFFRENSPLRRAMAHRWYEPARSNIRQFQFTSLQYRYTNRFEKMVAQLHKYPDFDYIWQQSRNNPMDTASMLRAFEYTHVEHGPVHYAATITPTLTPCGPLYMTIFAPSSTRTRDVFNELIQNKMGIRQIMPWPDVELVT